MMEKGFKKALVIGFLGSLLYKLFEYYIWYFVGGIPITFKLFISQTPFLILIPLLFTTLIYEFKKDIFYVSYVPSIYYIMKESYNYVIVSKLPLTDFLFSHAILEVFITLLFGFGIYAIVERYWK